MEGNLDTTKPRYSEQILQSIILNNSSLFPAP